MKKISEMSEHEMLEELMKDKRRRDVFDRIKIATAGVVIIVLVVLAVIYVPKAITLINQGRELAGKINGLVDQTSGVMDKLGDGTIDRLRETIEALSSLLKKLGL